MTKTKNIEALFDIYNIEICLFSNIQGDIGPSKNCLTSSRSLDFQKSGGGSRGGGGDKTCFGRKSNGSNISYLRSHKISKICG